MRKLMWFTIGFAAACFLEVRLVPGLYSLLWTGGALVLCAAFYWFRQRCKAFPILAVLCLGLTIGLAWFSIYDGIWLRAARNADDTTQEITLTVTDDPSSTDYGYRVPGIITLDGRTYKVLLYCSAASEPEPGQMLTLPARLRLTTDGGSQEPTFHRSNGIFLLAYGKGEPAVTQGELGWRKIPVSLRRWTRRTIAQCFPRDAQGLVTALVLGDTSGLTYNQRNAFSLIGVSHIAAVSGMHMSILFSIFLFLTLYRRWLSALLGIPILFLFSAMAGFTPSSVRAFLMLSLTVIAQILKKEYDAPTALSFAVLVLLIQNPVAADSVGLQMSVASVSGIIVFLDPISKWLRSLYMPKRKRIAKWWRGICSGVSVTLSASVFTIPIVASTFGVVSLISPLANILVLWAVTIVFGGSLAVSLLSLVWHGGAVMLAGFLGWLVRYIHWISRLLSRFPLAAIYPKYNPYSAGLVLFFGVLVLLLALRKGQGKRYFAFALALGVLVSVSLSWLDGTRDHFRVTVLDVGQGQCVILQAEGRAFVVDCGGTGGEIPGEEAARALLSMGIFHLDGIIVTHSDTDHISGIPQLTARIPTDLLFTADPPEAWEAVDIPVVTVERDTVISSGDMELSIFAPISRTGNNESGLSVLFTWQKYDTLITGDMSRSMERRLLDLHNLPDIELLIAGHHGSKNSTDPYLLETLRPEVVAVSVGDNSFGHPAQEVLDRVYAAGADLYRTDLNGTFTFRG